MAADMKRFALFITCILVLATHLASSRSIRDESIYRAVDGEDQEKASSFGLSATTESCEPTYGFLPCSSNVWGILFMIVVYEILLSVGGQFVGKGSNLFFEIIGPGVFGASLFQLLGTFPQIILILVSALSGSTEAAQQRATLSMGLVAGTTVMLLTLIWGISVILGSYDLSVVNTSDTTSADHKPLKGLGVVTDVETSYTARIMVITLIPLIVLLLGGFFGPSGRRVIILIALIITILLLVGYILYQIFRPSIQSRRFEHLMSKYAKDKLVRLFSKNGRPDVQKIQRLFESIDKNKNASVSASELRVLLLGVKMDNDDMDTERDIENVLGSFDTSGDGLITQDEFIRGMTTLVTNLNNLNALSSNNSASTNSKSNSQTQQPLLANGTAISAAGTKRAGNTWLNYLLATFYVVIGTIMLCALGEPLIKNVVMFSQATHISSFGVSFLAIPFALNYGVAIVSIVSARQKNQKSISLTLSSLYSGVYMNNVIGLIVFLGPVYARDLTADVATEVVVVVVICVLMTIFTSLRTTYYRWMGYIAVLLYPISLAVVYFLIAVIGLP